MSSEQPETVSPNNSNVGENGQPLTEAEIKARKNKKKKERAKRKKAAAKEAAAVAAAEGKGVATTGKKNGMDSSTKSAGGGKAPKNNNNNNNNNNKTNNNKNNKAGATNGAVSSELTSKLAAKEAELAQAQQVIADLVSKGKGLEKDNTKLQEDIKKLKNEVQAMETAMVQMKSAQSLPEIDGNSDAAARQIKALQAELTQTKESFAKDKIQLEENLKLAHKAQMDQAIAAQKNLQQELDKARSSAGAAAASPAGGNGVADVWQTKCVATAKQLKDEKKYVMVLEAEKKELEKQLEFASKEKKPWWMCG